MEYKYLIYYIIKYIFLTLSASYVLLKITNFKDLKKKTIIVLLTSCILSGIFIATFKVYFSLLIGIAIACTILTFIVSYITKYKFDYSATVLIISLAINFVFYIITLFLTSVVLNLIIENLHPNSLLYLLSIPLNILLIYFLFKVRKFKNGFSFIKNSKTLKEFGILGVLFSIAIIIIYSSLEKGIAIITETLIIGALIIALGVFIWIRKNYTLYYKERLKESDIYNLQEELEDYKKENDKVLKINHKYSGRISALEMQLKKLANTMRANTEFANEISDIAVIVKRLAKEYNQEISNNITPADSVPKTNVVGIDGILEYIQMEALKSDIKLIIKFKHKINYLIENFISESKLETLLFDHLKDAIIAINFRNSNTKNIMIVFDIVDGYYEIRISDTGIPFKIDTLVKLGLEAITTHADTGGSGIGFMTTFETLNETKASLIIEEKNPNESTYTKTIIFRFDGKNEYVISSHRIDEISNLCEDNRIKFLSLTSKK
ncbi:MAG: hypothetical protein FWF46_05960 [Oscillospiraceae bacterium]|nr:hypothetical protein [Oscillospiraceae bacterium]